MTQLQWPGLVMWPYKTNRSQQTKQVMCPEGKKLKMFSEHQNDYISSNLKSYLHIIYILSQLRFQILHLLNKYVYVCVFACVCLWISNIYIEIVLFMFESLFSVIPTA